MISINNWIFNIDGIEKNGTKNGFQILQNNWSTCFGVIKLRNFTERIQIIQNRICSVSTHEVCEI